MGWAIVPWRCYKLLKWIDARYDKPPIIITENGCSSPDELTGQVVNDSNRIHFVDG